jgi:hypothetical protein
VEIEAVAVVAFLWIVFLRLAPCAI